MSPVITTYLQDHHAGAGGGTAAFSRVAEMHGDPAVRAAVARLGEQVEQDEASLEQLMEAVGAKTSTVKDTATKLGEKVARLKPNERIASRSPLSDVVELEALEMAVHGKKLLWQGLLQITDPRLDAAELQRLLQRAEQQETELEQLRVSQLPKLLQE